METAKSWYLVYAKPRQEQIARVNLERQKYEVYLPLARQVRRRGGRRLSMVAPLFPRYLFVHLDREIDNWAPIRSTTGVMSLVRFGQTPAPVPDDLVDYLRAREDPDGLHVVSIDEYKRGARVRVTVGGLTGYEGIFVAPTSRQRVVVLLEILGKQTRAIIEAGSIEPAS
ncbi:MAG: transcription/translation regulatory transformer protein RfaH [Gammaproteobacteria bacterium]